MSGQKKMTERTFDLICFDLDGTLVEHPDGLVIWEVLNHRYIGNRQINKKRCEMFQSGEISYDEWVTLDVEGWVAAGATRDDVYDAVSEFELIEGAYETVHELKNRGFKLGIISGTLDVMLNGLFPDHPFDDVYTNQLYFDGRGRLDRWRATPFDGNGKPEALRLIADKYDIPLERAAYVGDGENDVPLLGVSGCFVAYEPRSKELEEGADIVIRGGGLRSLLDVFK